MARYAVRPSRGLSAMTGLVRLGLGVVGLVFFGKQFAAGARPFPWCSSAFGW